MTEELPPEEPLGAVSLAPLAPTEADVAASVRNHFPMIREATANRTIASGETLAAWGAFDRNSMATQIFNRSTSTKTTGASGGVKRDTLWGGQIGAGYKLGRGSFEPWYRERETNDLGELGISLRAPVIRDIFIDANRAELWRAQLEQGRVEPVIRLAVLFAVRDGAAAYWEWVAAGENLAIADSLLRLGLNRVRFLEEELAEGEGARIDITDNQRIIASRRAKQIDARRKLEQSAVKLSLFLRTPDGQPLVLPTDVATPSFPIAARPAATALAGDVPFAVSNRPELTELNFVRRQLNVLYQQACNETRPDVDAGLFLGQDIGNPTSSDDKSEFEIEATLTVSVPLERRKAFGKMRQLRGKLAQVRAKSPVCRRQGGGRCPRGPRRPDRRLGARRANPRGGRPRPANAAG